MKKHTGISLFLKFYPLLLVLFLLFFLLKCPITALDTDLWYHLNGGRYIVEHLSIPKNSFFSFIEPEREYVDYYWLFQVLIYGIFYFFGYHGLIIFRVLLLLSTLFFIYMLFFQKEKEGSPYFVFAFSLYLLLLIPRSLLIRPHMFSYFFIVFFLYLFERKKGKLYLLPLFSLFWVNIHGIEYPVMILILLSYFLDLFISSLKGTSGDAKGPFFSVFLSLFTVFLTPHGSKLPHIPFIPTDFASLYINELKKISFFDLFSYNFIRLSPTSFTVFNLIFISVLFILFSQFFKRSVRIAHLLLFFGALFLLFKANRFTYEFSLLCLPILKRYVDGLPSFSLKEIRTEKLLCLFLFLFMPFISIRTLFPPSYSFPLSPVSLPEGTCIFLNRLEKGGNLLNHPNLGGYLQFMLYPKYKIFMDMEVPFLFTNEDMFTAINLFHDKEILKHLIDKYNPDFILCPAENKGFQGLIRNFPFKIVFFDETGILFANEKKHPEIVKNYGLKFLDPFSLDRFRVEELKKRDLYDGVKRELLSLLNIYPYCGLKNAMMAEILFHEGLYMKAVESLERVLLKYPNNAQAWLLKARSLKAIGDYKGAELTLKEGLKRNKKSEDLWMELGLFYYERRNYKKAFKILKKVINPFDPRIDYKNFYYLVSSALNLGRKRDAEILINYGLSKLPAEEREWRKKYEELLKRTE